MCWLPCAGGHQRSPSGAAAQGLHQHIRCGCALDKTAATSRLHVWVEKSGSGGGGDLPCARAILLLALWGGPLCHQILATLQILPPNPLGFAYAQGFYGASDSATFSEASASGRDYLAEVCREWEAEALRARAGRTVILRTGVQRRNPHAPRDSSTTEKHQ